MDQTKTKIQTQTTHTAGVAQNRTNLHPRPADHLSRHTVASIKSQTHDVGAGQDSIHKYQGHDRTQSQLARVRPQIHQHVEPSHHHDWTETHLFS